METKHYKRLLFILSLLLIALIIAYAISSVLLYLGLFPLQNKQTNEKPKELCLTNSCIKAADSILQCLDETVDPCEDFYKFTCGSFDTRLDESKTQISNFQILYDQLSFSIADSLAEPIYQTDILATANAKKLYASCMNENLVEQKGLEPILKLINEELHGWPILNKFTNLQNQTNRSQSTVTEKLVWLAKTDSPQLFDFYVEINPIDPKHNVLMVYQPSWFFDPDYLSNKEIIDAYKLYVTKVLKYFIPNTEISAEIDSMLDIKSRFENLQSVYTRRSYFYTLKELSDEIPEFDWKHLIIMGLFNEIANVTIDENEMILISDLDYLKKASLLYSELVINQKKYTSILPRQFQDARLEFDKVYRGKRTKTKRTLFCSSMVQNKMGEAVDRLYVLKNFRKSAKQEASEMVSSILNEFNNILNESAWMDSMSKAKAYEKVAQMDRKIGYSEVIFNDSALNQIFADFKFSPTELLQNVYDSSVIRTKKYYSQLKIEVDKKMWISDAAVVNAFYSPNLNQICFPAGILQSPFYDAGCPKYLNYGGIGTVIGHEVTHGFDDDGRHYDKDGQFFSDKDEGLWSNETIENYKVKEQCIIDQYQHYIVEQINKTINGYKTQGENIADNGGLKEAFRAYQKWVGKNGPEPFLPGLEKYSQNQLFFINFGHTWCEKSRDERLIEDILRDPHSPAEYRVIGATSNSEEFAKAFKCKPKQKNNPDKKCSVW